VLVTRTPREASARRRIYGGVLRPRAVSALLLHYTMYRIAHVLYSSVTPKVLGQTRSNRARPGELDPPPPGRDGKCDDRQTNTKPRERKARRTSAAGVSGHCQYPSLARRLGLARSSICSARSSCMVRVRVRVGTDPVLVSQRQR
jgi:hypothetical protein